MQAIMLGDKDLEMIKTFTLSQQLREGDKKINDCPQNKMFLWHRVIIRGTQKCYENSEGSLTFLGSSGDSNGDGKYCFILQLQK